MKILDGKSLSLLCFEETAKKVQLFKKAYERTPQLAVILAGDDPASQVYVGHKMKACEKVGIESRMCKLPADIPPSSFQDLIAQLNQDTAVDGILVQLPLPNQLSKVPWQLLIDPLKDSDGLCPENMGLLFLGQKRVAPCTAQGVLRLLQHAGITLTGKSALVVGRSQIVGKPMAALLLEENCTVTIAHSKTTNVKALSQQSDIVVCALGQPHYFSAQDFKKGAVVVDVGIHRSRTADSPQKLIGDVNPDGLDQVASAATPVPGGVGPMTIAMLLNNTMQLAQMREQHNLSFGC